MFTVSQALPVYKAIGGKEESAHVVSRQVRSSCQLMTLRSPSALTL